MSFPRYPAYKNSGVAWLGEVPDHWGVCAVRRAADRIEQGWSPECEATPADDDSWGVLKAGCLNNGTFDANENKTLPSELAPMPEYEVCAGDVLMSRASGSPELVGSVALVKETRPKLMLSDKIFRIRLATMISPAYFVRMMSSRPLRGQIEQALSGGNGLANNLPQSVLLAFQIALPPIHEQASIAYFLDRETAKIDALLAEQEQLITLLNEEVDALVLSTFESDSTRKMRLEHAVDVIARPVIQSEDETYTPLGLYNRGRGLFHKDPRGQADMGDSDFFWIEPGDLIISGQFAWEGAVALADEEEKGCVVSHRYPVLRGRSGIALTEYIFALLCTRHGDFLLNESSWGAAGRNRPLNLGLLLKEKIPVPSLEKQKRIAGAVHNKKRLAAEMAIQRQFLQERRSALISAAVTGQIDVRGLAADKEAA